MIKQLKKFTVQMMAGANIATIIVMCLVGYSDRLSPTEHPVLSCVGMTFPLFLLANMVFLLFWIVFKFRMIWIPILGYALAYVPINIYMPLNLKSVDVPDDALKVISYNVCAYGGNFKYEQGFEKVRDYLFEQNADIVCLQEDVDTWRRYCFQHYEKKFAYNDTVQFVIRERGTRQRGRYPYPVPHHTSGAHSLPLAGQRQCGLVSANRERHVAGY